MKKLVLLLALTGSLAALAASPSAASGIYICTGIVGTPFDTTATTLDATVLVPGGATCSMYGVTVTGNVIVQGNLVAVGITLQQNLVVQGGSVSIGCAGSILCAIHGPNSILGNMVMLNAAAVRLVRTGASGNLTVVGAGSLDIQLAGLNGDVTIVNSANVFLFDVSIGGNARVINNSGVHIGSIDVSGTLDCEANSPPPDLGVGVHAAAFRGQCAPTP